jgi:nucleoside-diphosphate-sugar epimerase
MSDLVVVTGGAGYLGSVVVSHLLMEGAHVRVVDRLAGGGEALLGFYRHPRFELLAGDVRDTARMRQACREARAVVHLAAVVGEPACAVDEPASRAINTDGTRVMLDAAHEANVERFIYVSTCSNYGVSSPDELADEQAPLRPLGIYAQSKVEAERLVLADTRHPKRVVMRFGTICGLSSRMRFDLLVNEMARAAVLRESIEIFAPAAWRPYLHIRDAARAIAWALDAPPAASGQVFNVVGENYQKQGLIDLVRRHFPDAAVAVTERVPDARDYRATGERIRRVGGFTPQLTVEDAFVDMTSAVRSGMFRDVRSREHGAAPATTV